jgi:hypothetical protein
MAEDRQAGLWPTLNIEGDGMTQIVHEIDTFMNQHETVMRLT